MNTEIEFIDKKYTLRIAKLELQILNLKECIRLIVGNYGIRTEDINRLLEL